MGFIRMKRLPSADALRAVLRYDENTGDLYWLDRPNIKPSLVGKIAGVLKTDGYKSIKVFRKAYQMHRIIWCIYYGYEPPQQIDHVNRNRSDNRICNLRLASVSQNNINRQISDRNTSGCKGVRYRPKDRAWIARLILNRSEIHLGLFPSFEEAVAAREAAAKKYHGEFFCRGTSP